jgi:hypothetical protein
MNSIRYSEDPRLRTAQKVVFWTVVGLAGMAAFGLVFGVIIQWLWNATLADLFGLPSISFWQAVGIFILAKLLFGFGGGSGPGSTGKRETREKAKQRDAAEAREAAETADAESALPDLAEDEEFRRFWREEGREAYAVYRGRSTAREE